MKNLPSLILTALVIFVLPIAGYSQPDTAKITSKALDIADSLIKADKYENWKNYADLAPDGVIKYYGGKDGYIEHIRVGRMRTLSMIEEDAPVLKPLQFLSRNEEWQGVIRASRYIHKDDNTKLHVVTYFICQSKDDGETWRIFDVSYNSVANIIYLMPDINDELAIKEPSVMTPEEELAREQQAKAAAAGQKTTAKKK